MKLLFIILILIGLYSCTNAENDFKEKRGENKSSVRLIEIDGCQYVICGVYSYSPDAITHHGACSNPIHKQLKIN